MAYIARINIGAGGSWSRGDTPEEAIQILVQRVHDDWGRLFEINGIRRVALYKDGGTSSFDDDEFIRTVDSDFTK